MNQCHRIKTMDLRFVCGTGAAGAPRASFVATRAAWRITMPKGHQRPRSGSCVWGVKAFFTADRIKKLVVPPAVLGFFERASDMRRKTTPHQWNGAKRRLLHPPSSKSGCRHSHLSRESSILGYLPRRKKCAFAVPQRPPIRCVLIFLRMRPLQTARRPEVQRK
jgi:hypothetical protein